jgi:hypothetical protein
VTEAKGIHTLEDRKLGRRPNDPQKPRVNVSEFLNLSVPHPVVDPAPGLSWPMDRNDIAGDCVVAGLDHTLQAIHTALDGSYTNWTDDQILHAYQSQNPGFASWADAGGPNDNGMVIQDFLGWARKQGHILAFGEINRDYDTLRAATYIGLAIVTGEDLETAQQNQQTWDYSPSPDWGGHCTTWVGYHPKLTTVTWGSTLDMTDAFINNQVGEAWFVLTQAHVDHPGFRDNFDLAAFADAVHQITGGKVVVPTQPTPPAPTPPPPPTDVTVTFSASDLAVIRAWADKPHIWRLATAAAKAFKRGH